MRLLAKEQQESYENAKIRYICKEKIENKYLKDKEYPKVRDNCHYTGEYTGSVHNKYGVPKTIPIGFHNRSNYDYHVIIKEVAEEFKK